MSLHGEGRRTARSDKPGFILDLHGSHEEIRMPRCLSMRGTLPDDGRRPEGQKLPVGGVVPVAGDIGIMVLEKADLEAGTPAKLCEVHQTSAGWTRIN